MSKNAPFKEVMEDGEAWVCIGYSFTDLQSSDDYAYGDTREEAIENYYKMVEDNKRLYDE